MSRRVVVTGIGCIAPCGIGKDALLAAMRRPRSFIRRVTRFDATSLACQVAGEVDGFEPAGFMDGSEADRLDRGAQFGMAAAREALDDARLDMARLDPVRAGVALGVAAATMEFFERHYERWRLGESKVFRSYYYPAMASASASTVVAQMLGVRGRTVAVSTGCTAGAEAIGYAFRQIRAGRADVMIAGGSDSPLTPLTFASFTVMKAMAVKFNDEPERASRPFDKDRNGFVMSEGAGVLVLEEREHALRRGAAAYMEVAGYGTTLNANHMTEPHPEGVESARAMRLALTDAGLAPEAIDYVSAHGSSTPLNEKAETKAIKLAFGECARRLRISAIKSMLGHPFGAAAAHQAVACALAFRHDLIPATVNLETPDPECDLDYVPHAPRFESIRAALLNSCGFAGKNAALALRRIEAGNGAGSLHPAALPSAGCPRSVKQPSEHFSGVGSSA